MAGILDGKVALITGAGSGIGQATSRIFAREGAKLVLADVVEEGGNRTLKLVQDLGAEAVFVKCDVSKLGDVEATVAKAVQAFGRLDCAFNNAGIEGQRGETHECSEENWARVIAIDLTGVWLCMKAEIAQLLKQGSRRLDRQYFFRRGTCGRARDAGIRRRQAWRGGSYAGGSARIREDRNSHQRCLSRTDPDADDGTTDARPPGYRAAVRAIRAAKAIGRARRDR